MVQTNSIKPKLVVLTGPTAVGKSDFAVTLAQTFNGEIVSADSMQIYRGMNVGTGKITAEEMQGIPHHMLDIVDVGQDYSASDYIQEATKVIADVTKRGKLPIVVGGTGFYLNGLINGYNFSTTKKDDAVREKWKSIANEKGVAYVHEKLKEIDPKSAAEIAPNDLKRVIRALEIYELTGQTRDCSYKTEKPYQELMLVLTAEREKLYERINARVDKMFRNGLVEEVAQFTDLPDSQAMQSIGYKEVIRHLQGELTLSNAIEEVKKHSRNYAKRQMTFFRWIDCPNKHFSENKEELTKLMESFLQI